MEELTEQEVVEVERPKTPTQLRRLREEDAKDTERLLEKREEEGSTKSLNINDESIKKIDIEEEVKGIDMLKGDIGQLEFLDRNLTNESPEKSNFRDFIFSPNKEIINTSSSSPQLNHVKAMM